MHGEHIVIGRAKIYDEVWTEPVDKVAKRYGVSNVMLAKICRKLNVPVPPRGHWARVAAGQKIARARLPKARAGELTEHVVAQAPSLHPVAPIAPEVREKIALERRDEHRIVVADSLTDPHPLIEKSLPTLRMSSEARANARLKRAVLAVNVSSAHLDRAIRIMDAVLKALDARGHRCVVSRPEASSPTDRTVTTRRRAEPAHASASTSCSLRSTKRWTASSSSRRTPSRLVSRIGTTRSSGSCGARGRRLATSRPGTSR